MYVKILTGKTKRGIYLVPDYNSVSSMRACVFPTVFCIVSPEIISRDRWS